MRPDLFPREGGESSSETPSSRRSRPGKVDTKVKKTMSAASATGGLGSKERACGFSGVTLIVTRSFHWICAVYRTGNQAMKSHHPSALYFSEIQTGDQT